MTTMESVTRCLNFFASAIRSGEPWTEACEREYQAALAALASVPGGGASPVDEIAGERRRQVEVEGWMPEYDDLHTDGRLARAAVCYAMSAGRPFYTTLSKPPWWPFAITWWKPTSRRRDLIKAAALIVAEIERLDRAAALNTQTGRVDERPLLGKDAKPLGEISPAELRKLYPRG
jgi:hypothetical protein